MQCSNYSSIVPQLVVIDAVLLSLLLGVIGETKDPANHGDEKVECVEFLKFPDDESYEVVSPFSSKCAGCYEN